MSYKIAIAEYQAEYVVKKSRFIARLLPVRNREEVNAAVAKARADYPDARHHCWAYLLGPPADARGAGMNDDGEPAGTAGRPILNVLQHGHLGDVLVIVVRYFGGIKLGAGGLVRAYSAATREAVEAAPCRQREQLACWRARGDFACEQPLRHWLDQHGGYLDSVCYGEQVQLDLRAPAAQAETLAALCAAHRISLEELI
ncbi:IMPACT family protein [Parahaliea mediterranea]|uniref:YigZ family protein n=1 Tax=Parahaliea mediterranea TaxID=651086 RepID=A0A939IJF1_9GAMM|nr:YigZ family protein [Parahaliea mediterranea]MBN7796231.1 YigZ family protein [Parahaliea mediterranea]